MLHLPEGTISGRPQPIGDFIAADCVLMQEFGSDPDLKTNEAIINYALERPEIWELPQFVSNSLARRMSQRGHGENIAYVFEGKSASGVSENLGTYGEWAQFFDAAIPAGMETPVLVTNGHNVGNSHRQGLLFGIESVIPADLPHGFDWRSVRSGQLWTSNWACWALTAHLRHYLLLKNDH